MSKAEVGQPVGQTVRKKVSRTVRQDTAKIREAGLRARPPSFLQLTSTADFSEKNPCPKANPSHSPPHGDRKASYVATSRCGMAIGI